VRYRLPHLRGRVLKHGSRLMSMESYIGIAAGVCTAISLLPQLIKIIREKKADNISYFMLFILLAGLGLWVWYGVLKKDYPIIATNSFSFLVNSLVIYFTMRYKKENK
jgi:MtN3 and saliva related transmembrane protein